MAPHSRSARRGPLFTRTAIAALAGVLTLGVIATSPADASKLSGSITVSAASSLTGVFTQLGHSFEAAHPSTSIAFNFASSSILETQIQQGSPADVFASASVKDMGLAQKAGDIVGSTPIFTRNTLAIVVKPGNPLHIHSLKDLLKAKVVALCAATAPCGEAAREVLATSKVVIRGSKISLGQDVKSTLAQVTSGDADAAIVYVTDARSVAGEVNAVAIPAAQNVVTAYPIGLVKASTHRSLARAWMAYVLSAIGQRALHAAGFLPVH